MVTRPRLNIYLDSEDILERVKIGAAKRRTTLSEYCLEAVRERLARDGLVKLTPGEQRAKLRRAAAELDRLRTVVGRIGVPVTELISQGRRE